MLDNISDFISQLFALPAFHQVCLLFGVGMLLWDTVEVGRNDAANLVNAVLGAGVLRRRSAVFLAGLAVIVGAVMSSDVIDTARKGIFSPTELGTLEAALTIYISVYLIDTVLLYSYSAFGMPVSTTACLVFELLGAALAINASTVNWNKAGTVMAGIFCSIILSGIAAFFIQRAARGAIRDRTDQLSTLLLHGGWVGGGLMTGLCYFLVLKGMKNVSWIKMFRSWLDELSADAGGVADMILIVLVWAFCAIFIHLLLVIFRKKAARLLFSVLSVVGMMAMAFAFGQNDLANCASPGLATWNLIQAQDLQIGTKVPISSWLLLLCGVLLVAGMSTKNAQRVTKAAVATGSMGDRVALWAPKWCVDLASWLLKFRSTAPALAPRATLTAAGKTRHYDTLRGSVIMAVSASVIATASSLGLPVSTTYVAFAAVVATGMADRIFQRGDAELKLARSIWVVLSWVLSALIAATAAFLIATVVHHFTIAGMFGCLVANLLIRRMFKKRADAQARRVAEDMEDRLHPEDFALEQEDI